MAYNRNIAIELVLRTIIVLSFLIVSGVVIASANGYLFNPESLSFEETGIINLTVSPTPVDVSLNGKKKTYVKDYINLVYLLPGQYTIEITKAGYMTWNRNVYLRAGEAVVNPWVTLFWADGHTSPATAAHVSLLEGLSDTPENYADLDVRSHELWVSPLTRTYPIPAAGDTMELIGRFSNPIDRAVWYSGRSRLHTHIIFQTGNEIRIVDRDGSNDHLLVTLNQTTPTLFTVSDDNKYLIYRDGEAAFERQLIE
jgi:hypothetical protein